MHSAHQRGSINLILMIFIIVMSIVLGGGLLTPKKADVQEEAPTSSNACCDDENCALIDPSIQFEGKTYKLIKSDIALTEQWGHLTDSGEKTADGDPIYINTTETTSNHPECGQQGENDLFFGGPGGGCIKSGDDQIIYVCKNECSGHTNTPLAGPNVGFGKFDAYFIDDGTEVPDFIKQCTQDSPWFGGAVPGQAGGDLIVFPSPQPEAEKSLQLRNFKIVKRPNTATPWLSPYCKPAIYLYPEQVTDVNVQVKTLGGLTMTLPEYPLTGWNVTAYPDGQLLYQNTFYDYLYYESQIPDEILKEPIEGYIFEYSKLSEELNKILSKLGLNEKEKQDFLTYWTSVLPQSPYYFIGIMTYQELEQYSQLEVTPKPDNEIRVTLFFKEINQPFSVNNPTFKTPTRSGFTIVEWGGIFKNRKGTNFTCLM